MADVGDERRAVSPVVIALEGTDGAGKSTWASWLESYLQNKGVSTTTLPEFDYGPIGIAIADQVRQRGIWSLGDSPAQLFASFAAIASDLILKVCRPQSASIVIADRHLLSILECQFAPLHALCSSDERGRRYVHAAETIIALIPPPTMTVVLTLDSKTRVDRLRARGDTFTEPIERVLEHRDKARAWALEAYGHQLGTVLKIDARHGTSTEGELTAGIRALIGDALEK